MKYYLLFTVFLTILFGCRSKNEIISDTYENGKPKVIKIYSVQGKDSILTGRKQFYENGKLEMIGHYTKEKLRDDKWKYYYENGNLWSECDYTAGLKQGKNSVYYENGKIHYKGVYKGNKQTGNWQYFDEEGNLVKEKNYDLE